MDRRVYLLTGCIGLVGANSLSLAPIAPSVSADMGNVSVTQVLWATGGYGLGTAVAALTLAPFVDRYGGLHLLRIAMAVLTTCFIASALAPILWALIIFQTIAGLAAGVALPATYGLGSDIAKKGEEARTMGLILTGWMLAMVFGVTCATLIADLLNWRVLFVGFAVLAGIALITLMWITVETTQAKALTSPLSSLSIPGMGRGIGMTLAYMLAFYGTYPFLAPNIVENIGMAASATALPILSYGVGFGVSSILDAWLDRHPYRYTALRVFGATTVALTFLCLSTNSYVLIIIGMGLYGVFNHAGLTLILNRLITLAPSKKGAILGIYAATTYAAVSIGAIGFAPIYAITGYAGVTVVAATLALFMALESRTVKTSRNAASY